MTSRRRVPGDENSGARRTTQDLVAGRIVRPHGLRGAVVLESETDLLARVGPETKVFLGERKLPATVRRLIPHGRRYLMELEGVDTREKAEDLREAAVRVRLEDIGDLPPNTYFRWQIVGLKAVEEDGTELGTVVEVLETGANDVYEVERAGGGRLLLPAIDSVVREIDLDGGILRVRLLPGLDDAH